MPSPDYEEFIAVLNAHGVRYLVVGAHAVAFHARPAASARSGLSAVDVIDSFLFERTGYASPRTRTWR